MKRSEKKFKIIIFSITIFLLLNFLLLVIFFSFSFKLNGEDYIEINYNDGYKDLGVNASLFGINLSKNVKVKGKVDSTKMGKNKIKYSYRFFFIKNELERVVVIKDIEKPIITLNGEEIENLCPNQKYLEEGYTAIDDFDGDLTDKVEITESDDNIEYKVTDSSGNVAVKARKINRKDVGKPVITLNGETIMNINQNDIFKELGYNATDICDGDLTKKVNVKGQVNTKRQGTYTIEYSVSDTSGNSETVKRQVVVGPPDPTDALPGVIYLTFDDGPSNTSSTSKILDVLKQEDVKATFFVTSSGSDDLIRREYEEGHTIALHTYTHDYSSVYSSVSEYFADLEKIQNRVKNIIGEEVKIIRFPGGSDNTISDKYSEGIMKTLIEEVEEKGYTYFDWNVDGNDAGKCARSSIFDKTECVFENVTSNLSKSRDNVVLMHDVKSYTADAIEDIIKYGKDHNYTFKAITSKTKAVHN